VLLDYSLPDFDGLELLRLLAQAQSSAGEPLPVVVMLTGQGSERVAVEAMKQGAQDYLVKDSLSHDNLPRVVLAAIEKHRLRQQLLEKEQECKRADAALRSSDERFRSAMAAASIGMALVDLQGRWLEVNTSLCELLGYTEDELLANDFQSITHPDDLAQDLACIKRLVNGEIKRYRVEKRYFHKSGSTIWARLSVSLVRDTAGTPRYLVSQLEDITQEREAERVKGEFVSMVSHELRTPLTSIRGSLGLILGALSADASPQLLELLNIAHNNCQRLIKLINDILDIDKIASGGMRFDMRQHSLARLSQVAIEGSSGYAQNLRVRIALQPIDPRITLMLDEDRYVQVLTNLLSNAIKFSPPGGTINIGTRIQGGLARVCVVDRGAGIPKEFHSRIFGKFSQADSSTARRAGGTGLGLHIARQIVEQMNGVIGFDSELGRGSTFWVEFPICEEGEAPAAAATRDLVANLPMILHIEDDIDISRVLSVTLRDRAEIVLATTLHEAAELLQCHPFDMIILDDRLPDGTGLEFLEGLNHSSRPVPPVLMLCAEPPPPWIYEKVGSVLVKSQAPDQHIVDAVSALLAPIHPVGLARVSAA
jgi:PAS domain S-box-containing protein